MHIIFLCPGMNGLPSACQFLKKKLIEKCSPGTIVYTCKSNWPAPFSFWWTRDGIDEGGVRLAEEIRQVCSKYPCLKAISFVGISLGGIYLRFAIGTLMKRGTICGLMPVIFVTLGSPHLGVYRELNSVQRRLTVKLFGKTGSQLLLQDTYKNDQPLLVYLSDPTGIYVHALSRFSKRLVYGVREHDSGRVPFLSAVILPPIGLQLQIGKTNIAPEFPHIFGEIHLQSKDEMYDYIQQNRDDSQVSQSDSIPPEMESYEITMTNNLRSLPWTHIEVNFTSWYGKLTSHNNMAVNIEMFNSLGKDVAHHCVKRISRALDARRIVLKKESFMFMENNPKLMKLRSGSF